MKKHFTIIKILTAALGLLILEACVNPFINPWKNESAVMSEGSGLVRIGTGAERTALPAAVFHHYVYSFSHNGGAEQTIAPTEAGGNEFELVPGAWMVTVRAYAEAGDSSLAATGSASFEVALGTETQVTVKLNPETGSGTGTLNYALSYPDGASVNYFTLTLLADTAGINLIQGAAMDSVSLTGSQPVGSGYYAASAALTRNGVQTVKTEVVHIYKNLSTDLALEFTEADFRAILVFSSANSGPGSLREAIANAPPGATIALDLPENDRVITLTSTLAITKNLTIYGGGATLTQSGFTGSLATVTGTDLVTITATLNRFHFKGGRTTGNGGAISTNHARLNLESCVFSGNHANGSGGAVYAANVRIGGSTFYGNSADGSGGAVFGEGSFTGNIFYKNTAGTTGPALSTTNSVYALNLTDSADWSLNPGEKPVSELPLSPLSFRPLGGGAALGMLVPRPPEYPVVDFYGRPVPSTGGAAGAAQTATATDGFILDYGPTGSGSVNIISGAVPDADGIVKGSTTLSAQENPDGAFRYWVVDGVKDLETTELTLTIDTRHTTARAVFFVKVSDSVLGDHVPGGLRAAVNAAGGSGIVLPDGKTFSLYGDLTIDSNLIIEGNGSTLNLNGRHILISGATTEVRISRLHLKGGKAWSGGAIENGGILALESCIFSNNQATSSSASGGGALYSTGSLTILGSSFYGNSAETGQGGAIRMQSGTAVLQGNVFWGNTAASNPVIMGSVTSEGFNISDQSVASLNQTGDDVALVLPFTTVSFKPFTGEAAAMAKIGNTRRSDYPLLDFYGDDVLETDAAAGAVQETINPTGYVLDYAALGAGEVRVISGQEPDADGLTSGYVTFQAVNGAGGTFLHWIVNGIKEEPAPDPPNELVYDVQNHTVVRAVFSTTWTVINGENGGPGSFREALAVAADGDTIVLDGKTIILTEVLPDIEKKLTVKGEGATITQSGFIPGSATQLLRLASGAEVSISRVHFKGGRATTGAAIYNVRGTLTIESCIFSDNRANNPSGSADGGAIHNDYGYLNVYGCTFYDNSATGSSSYGGAIDTSGSHTTLTGNVFWGNTAANSPVAYGAATSNYNITDVTFSGSTVVPFLPFTPVSFKPVAGAGADTPIDVSSITAYPTQDFYGIAINSSSAAAGAVQTPASGYSLEYLAEGPGMAALIDNGTPDADGLYEGGSVTLRAVPNIGKGFLYWIVNGTRLPNQPTPTELVLPMDGHRIVRAIFPEWMVTSSANDGAGSLREALTGAVDGDRIAFQAQTVTLTGPLPQITKSIVIEGNGATLTQSGFTPGAESQLLYINSTTAKVKISRLHFKGGRATTGGAAIRNNGGQLTLESCIFSDNRTSASGSAGGALYTSGSTASMTVSGCTFYGNAAATAGTSSGGAIYRNGTSTVTLTGNIFWGNMADTYPVTRASSGSITSGGYNISDKEISASATGSGWAFADGDEKVDAMPFSPVSLKPRNGGGAVNKITPLPADYPVVDFYGAPITAGAAAGAIQGATAAGYLLDYAAQGQGTVDLTGGSVDSDSIASSSVTLTAVPGGSDASFIRWMVNEVEDNETSPVLHLTMNGDKTVRAIFAGTWPVTSNNNDGPGSLRHAVSNALAGDVIALQTPTVTLTATLTINKNLEILGNGATITQTGLTISAEHPLLSITAGTTVRINRVHFTGGRSKDQGSAIKNSGNLTLESCIFSDNITDYGSSYADGGAIYTATGSLTVLGCTFFENKADPAGRGGAIQRAGGTLTLTGNIFAGNIGQYPVVYGGGSSTTSGGYNVSDVASGTGLGQSGWTFKSDPADVQGSVVLDNGDFKLISFTPAVSETTLPAIPPLLAGFPATYFDGSPRGTTPGAMPSN